jgi:DNA mismatch repair ATPase MutS
LETVSALAGYGWLNPQSTFPTFHADKSVPVFVGQGIGHPLLPDERKVRNDFTINHLGEVAILTGSNMSGKSTLLKALGVNLALAYAGGVVDVQALHTLRFRLFTCIKVSDSVMDGISYFYAEVQRLRALLNDLADDQDLPLFFAVDEIFRGTNNRERLIGSRAYIRALVGQRGVGLISTHDLELIRLEDEVAGVTNYHFRDDVIKGRMVFDYRLRRGPSPTTNALRIMALEGLPVE